MRENAINYKASTEQKGKCLDQDIEKDTCPFISSGDSQLGHTTGKALEMILNQFKF